MDRPHVFVYQTASVDGRLAVSRDTLLLYGDQRWQAVIGSAQDGEPYRAAKELAQPQAILEGSGSLVRDDDIPSHLPPFTGDLAALYQDFLPESIVNRPGHRGWFTVPDSRGRVRWLYKEYPGEEWVGWYALVLAARCTPPPYLAYLQSENIPYLIAGEQRVDLPLALEKMSSQLGVSRLLSTAGGRLNGALLRSGLVDEVFIDFFPALIGGTDTPSLFDSPALGPGELPARLELLSAQPRPDGHVWLHYRLQGL